MRDLIVDHGDGNGHLGDLIVDHGDTTYPPRALIAQSDALMALRPSRDCSGLWMVHDERDRAVPPFDSTVMLDRIPGTWSPGDEPGDPV